MVPGLSCFAIRFITFKLWSHSTLKVILTFYVVLTLKYFFIIYLDYPNKTVFSNFLPDNESSLPFHLSKDNLSLYSHLYSLDDLCNRQLHCHLYILYKQISTKQLLLLVSNCFGHFWSNLWVNRHSSSSTDYGTNFTC